MLAPVPFTSVLTVTPNVSVNAGLRSASRPVSCVLVVVARDARHLEEAPALYRHGNNGRRTGP